MKQLSAGVIITDGLSILACRPFGRKNLKHNYDLPKGHVEEGEDYRDTAVRECMEETGFVIRDPEKMVDLGLFPYIPTKDLYLYLYAIDDPPDLSSLECTSYWDMDGQKVPEVADYRLVPVEELDWFFKSLEPVVTKALDSFAQNEAQENEAIDSIRNWD